MALKRQDGDLIITRAIIVGLQARQHFGNEAQDTMLVEECGELLTALAREKRGRFTRDQVNEEIADVLLVALGAANESVLDHLERKVERLKGRL
jgi:NTP pyrophosphatase (non-canonical NTP hydrolase)